MTITELFRLTFFCGLLVVVTVELCHYASKAPWHWLEKLPL